MALAWMELAFIDQFTIVFMILFQIDCVEAQSLKGNQCFQILTIWSVYAVHSLLP